MKNYIDEKFYNLINKLENENIYNIYINMVKNFNKLDILTQKSIEDFLNRFKYWGNICTSEQNFECLYLKANILKNNLTDYIWLYENLEDYKSKYILFSILNNFYCFDFENLSNCMERIYKHYFDLDLLPNLKDEIFVDVGAYIGDTILDYISTYGEASYKKIYAYELSEENIKFLKQNLNGNKNIIPKQNAVLEENKILKYSDNIDSSATKLEESGELSVQGVSLDSDLEENITMLKMDIEGGEKNALIGAKEHIKKGKVKLLISVYHNNTDLFTLPKLIRDYNPNYNLHLRYYGGPIFPTEIVLIALPKK